MFAKLSLSVIAALLLSAAPLLAGGLPRLCLPVDGVTAGNSADCAKRVAGALGDRAEQIEMLQNDKQWYVLAAINGDQADLGKLDAAFKGSPFSIPRDRLRLFGPMTLEVQIDESATAKFLADLKAVKHLRIEESKRDRGTLFVTVTTPLSRHFGREAADFGKVAFDQERFGAEPNDFGLKADPPATARDLPSYAGLRAVVEKHNGTLKGVRWKLLGCHVQGAVAVLDSDEKRK
jgi:hypothetical protein